MGAVNLQTYDWADRGEAPSSAGVAAYRAGDEPIAGSDNNWNWKVREDIKKLNNKLGTVDGRVGTLESDTSSLDSRLTTLENNYNSHNHDARYYRQTEADDTFVDATGDLMTGTLEIDESLDSLFVGHGNTSDMTLSVQDGNGRSHWYWNVNAGPQTIIKDNEGAGWINVDGGSIELSVYSGAVGDAGTAVPWTTALRVDESSAKVFGNEIATENWVSNNYATGGHNHDGRYVDQAGDTMSGPLSLAENNVNQINHAKFITSGNDFLTLTDGSAGSNASPYTFKFADRGFRFYSSTNNIPLFELSQTGSVTVPNGDVSSNGYRSTGINALQMDARDATNNWVMHEGNTGPVFAPSATADSTDWDFSKGLHIDENGIETRGPSQTVNIGEESDGGPHTLRFGWGGVTSGVDIVYRTGPNHLNFERSDNGVTLMSVRHDDNRVDFSGSEAINVPVHTTDPAGVGPGALYLVE